MTFMENMAEGDFICESTSEDSDKPLGERELDDLLVGLAKVTRNTKTNDISIDICIAACFYRC